MSKSRRELLFAAGAVALGYMGYRIVPGLLPKRLELEPLDRPQGFRKYVAGETSSGGFDPFVGLEADDPTEVAVRREAADRRVGEDVCGALYAGLDLSGGVVPMASFSDYYCPYCRVQTKRLADLSRGDPGIAVAWHELPLLGESSDLAAKAALAAKRQGAYPEFHVRLMKSPFQATPQFLDALARDIGVDGSQLMADMDSPGIRRELQDSAALSRLFAFVGTPALVIGRTVVQGQVSDGMIREIVELERGEGLGAICADA